MKRETEEWIKIAEEELEAAVRYPAALGLLPAGAPTMEDADRALYSARKVRTWLQQVLT